jgi:uncharacterized protein YodC (DUF2158 family)
MVEVVALAAKRSAENITPGKFARGQVVTLKSKGAAMTIGKVAKTQITCDWHADDKTPIQWVYHADQLEHYFGDAAENAETEIGDE